MKNLAGYEAILKVITAASLGVRSARVVFPNDALPGDKAIQMAEALNRILGELDNCTGALNDQYKNLSKTEEELRQSQKMEGIGRLAGGIAHDFNNLLSSVTGFSGLLLEELPAEHPLREYAEEIQKAGWRGADLTKQLLAFSRQQVAEPKIFDLNTLMARMEAMLRRLIGEDIELRNLQGDHLAMIRADPSHLEQVIMNLAVNAQDAMPQGGTLTFETMNIVLDEAYSREHPETPAGDYVMLAVTDTGRGMDKATQERIFEPFFTTKVMGKGSGLGLSTVYGIVKQNGGSITVYSEPDMGTIFKAYFPATRQKADEAGLEVLKHRDRRGSERILLVDDDEAVRLVTKKVLQKNGYVVLEAKDGKEAETVSQVPGVIHLLLTDMIMPGINGLELSRRLAGQRPEMRVLFMSGYTEDAVMRRNLLDSSVSLLQKPIASAALLEKVHEVLGRPDAG